MAYNRPPLFEMVIEFRTEPRGTDAEISKMEKRLKAQYPIREETTTFEFMVSPQAQATVQRQGRDAVILKSTDASDAVHLRTAGLIYVRTPPYMGWEEFSSTVEKLWKIWSKEAGHRKVTRLGVRSRNRFDIPVALAETQKPSTFVKLVPTQPYLDYDQKGFAVQTVGRLHDHYECILQAATADSPLIDHAALLLDIDLGRDIDVPKDWPDISAVISDMRTIRNAIFEACLTDDARELIK